MSFRYDSNHLMPTAIHQSFPKEGKNKDPVQYGASDLPVDIVESRNFLEAVKNQNFKTLKHLL